MKYLLQIFTIILFLSCNKKNSSNNYFSISENNAKYDSIIQSIKNDTLKELPPSPPIDKKLNLNYQIGAIHFMILDTISIYYFVNKLESNFIMCGNDYVPFNKQDSLNYIKRNTEKISQAKKIKTKEIINILDIYKKEIVKNQNLPLTISFSSKNDTIKGDVMKNIFEFMDNEGMKLYFIRRFNDAENNANFK